MKINAEQLAKIIKSTAVLAAVAGVPITPEHVEGLTAGAGAVYGIVSILEAMYFKKSKPAA